MGWIGWDPEKDAPHHQTHGRPSTYRPSKRQPAKVYATEARAKAYAPAAREVFLLDDREQCLLEDDS